MKKLIIGLLIFVSIVSSVWGYDEARLFDAVKSKNLNRVNAYIYANANQQFAYGGRNLTALQLAVENNSFNIVKALVVDGNADVNVSNGEEPPLFIAIKNNNADIIDFLIKNGANVNTVYKNQTPILYAITSRRGNSSGALRYLIKSADMHGADIDYGFTDESGRGIMHYAATGADFNTMRNGDSDLLGFLLEDSRCSLTQQDVNGWTALHMMAYAGRGELLQQVVYGRNDKQLFSVRNRANETPISLFIQNGLQSGRLDLGTISAITSLPGFTVADLAMPSNSLESNGIFIIGAYCDTDTTRVKAIFNNVLRTNKNLAATENMEGIPLLCYAVDEEWNEEIVELLIKSYRGDWTKLRDGKNNAIDIMRKNRSEDLYQDIFDAYM